MACGCFKKGKKVKQDIVDDVDKTVTNYARSTDGHQNKTRGLINILVQLIQESPHSDDADIIDRYTHINERVAQYEKNEKELDAKKIKALGSVCTLLEEVPTKKKRESLYESIDGRKLEEYLAEENHKNRPDICVLKQTADSSRGNQIRRSKSDEHENQPLKISTEKELREQSSAGHKRNDSYGQMSEYDTNNDRRSSRKESKICESVKSDQAFRGSMEKVNHCPENVCIKREEYEKLKQVLKESETKNEENKCFIEKLANEKKILKDDIEQKLEVESKEKKKLSENIQNLNFKVSSLEAQLKASNDSLSKEKLDYEQNLKSISKTSRNEGRESEGKLRNDITDLKEDIKKKTERNIYLESQMQVQRRNITDLEEKIRNERESNTVKQRENERMKRQLEEMKFDLKTAEEKTMSNVEKSIQENKRLTEDKKELMNTLTVLQENMQGQEATFVAEVSDLKQKKSKLKEKNVGMEKNIQILQKTLSSQKESYDAKVAEQTQEVAGLIQEKGELLGKIADMEKNIQTLHITHTSQKESFESKIKDLTRDKNALTGKLAEMEENIQGLQTTATSQKESYDAVVKELAQDKHVLKEKVTDMEHVVQDIEATLLSQKETFETKEADLTQNLRYLQEKNLETETTLKSLNQELLELQQMYDAAKEELNQFKSIMIIQIQLYHNSRVSLVSKIENELKSQLKQKLECSTAKLEFIDCEKATDIDPNKPLLIVCICASRLGTDAANSIQSLKLTSNMALLVFHHKDAHALPNQASEHVLTGNEYKRLGGIFDFGFLSDKGMYFCELNDRNFKNIMHFINSAGAKSASK